MKLFDNLYQEMLDTLYLKSLHIQDPMATFEAIPLTDKLIKVEMHSAFRAFCHVEEKKVFAIIPLGEGLIFNLESLKVGEVGLTNSQTPCFLRSYEAPPPFLFLELDGSNRHYQLLSSTSMSLLLPQNNVLMSDRETPEAYIKKVSSALKMSEPAMRPINIYGRSRTPRKNLVADMMKNICSNMDSKLAIELAMEKYQISERTARDAFLEVIGTTPKKFLLDQLLFSYRQLLSSNHRNSIESICKQLKISTPGRIAKPYYELFKEKPSATLKRCQVNFKDSL